MGYWLIAYNIEGYVDIENIITTEHPFDFLISMNKKGVKATLVNFWSLTRSQYRKMIRGLKMSD